MKKQEYMLVIIVGLFLLSYILDAVVNPLTVPLTTPYHFITLENITTYPFTTASIAIRALGMFILPLWIFGFFKGGYPAKGGISLVLAGLMQLYAIQEVATGARLVPLEWSLSLSVAGIALLLPTMWYFVRGGLSSMHKSLVEPLESAPLPKGEAGKKPNFKL